MLQTEIFIIHAMLSQTGKILPENQHLEKTRNLLSDGQKIAGNVIVWQDENHERCCVYLWRPSEVRRTGGHVTRKSHRRNEKSTPVDVNQDRRVRQEDRHIVPAGVLQQSQWVGGSWE